MLFLDGLIAFFLFFFGYKKTNANGLSPVIRKKYLERTFICPLLGGFVAKYQGDERIAITKASRTEFFPDCKYAFMVFRIKDPSIFPKQKIVN